MDLVVLPATVEDSQGKLVTGLTEDNFEILEDGVHQRISNFSIDPQPLSAAIVIDDGMNGNQLRRLYLPIHHARGAREEFRNPQDIRRNTSG